MSIGFVRVKPVHAPPSSAAAYRLGTQIGESKDYSAKSKEVRYSEVMLPDGAQKIDNLAALYKSMELAENALNKTTKKGAKIRYGKELIIALPQELSVETNAAAIRELCKGIVNDGYAVTLSLHYPSPKGRLIKGDGEDDIERNPHAHVMIFPRKFIGGAENAVNQTQSNDIGTVAQGPENSPAAAMVGNFSWQRYQDQDHPGQSDGVRPSHLSDLRLRPMAEVSKKTTDILRPATSNNLSKRQSRQCHPRRLSRLARLAAIDDAARSLAGIWSTQKDKKVYLLDESGNRVPQIDKETGQQKRGKKNDLQWVRVTDGLDHPQWRIDQEAKWESIINKELLAAGLEPISMAQKDKHGVWHLGEHDRATQIHLTPTEVAQERSGMQTEAGDYCRTAKSINKAAAALARKQAEAARLEAALAAAKPTPAKTSARASSAPASAPARIGFADDGIGQFLIIDRPGQKPLAAGIVADEKGKPRLGPVLDTSQTAALLANANIEYQKTLSDLAAASLGALAPLHGDTGAVWRDLMAEMSEAARMEIEETMRERVESARTQAEIAADQHRQALEAARQMRGLGR